MKRLIPLLALSSMSCGESVPAEDAQQTSSASASEMDIRAASPLDRSSRRQSGADGMQRYAVTLPVRACPDPQDFQESVDKLLLANPSHPLPERCQELARGTILLMEPAGQAPTALYKGFVFEQAMLQDGNPIWSDEFNSLSVKRSEVSVR
jgi:hypothetical protein